MNNYGFPIAVLIGFPIYVLLNRLGVYVRWVCEQVLVDRINFESNKGLRIVSMKELEFMLNVKMTHPATPASMRFVTVDILRDGCLKRR